MEVWLYSKLKDAGLTQKELAKRIGISAHSLCNKFGGKVPFTYREVITICDVLGIDNPREFFKNEK